jgi:hypothetical protein
MAIHQPSHLFVAKFIHMPKRLQRQETVCAFPEILPQRIAASRYRLNVNDHSFKEGLTSLHGSQDRHQILKTVAEPLREPVLQIERHSDFDRAHTLQCRHLRTSGLFGFPGMDKRCCLVPNVRYR